MIAAAAGWTGIVLGLASSLVLAVLGLRAQRHPDRVRRNQLRVAVLGMVAGAAVAFGALEVALLTDDFAVSYVAENSARATPVLFTITSAWSALEGSIVLWVLVLAGFTATVLRGVGDTDDRLGAGALGVMGVVAVFFFGLVSTVANPFGIVADPPLDGPGPNPLLQNHLLVAFHPRCSISATSASPSRSLSPCPRCCAARPVPSGCAGPAGPTWSPGRA